MKKFPSLLLILILLSTQSICQPKLRPSQWASPVINTELENFYKISDKLYRSEQPNAQSIKEFESMGIGSILNLRKHHTDNDEAKDSQMVLTHIKMSARNVTSDQIYQALNAINKSKNPIVIHCWHGSDRTGVVAAAYRMVFQDWSSEQAIDEFINGGFGYHEWAFPNLIELLKALDVENLKSRLELNKIDYIELK